MPYANSHGTRIHYKVVGDGPPLVLHHGFTETLDSWHRKGFVAALKQQYKLILFDARGHGQSDKPHVPDAYSLRRGAADVVCVLDAVNVEQAHYCGYSLGGWTGFGLATYALPRIRSLTIGGAQPYGQDLAVYRAMLREDMRACLKALERSAGAALPQLLRETFLQNDIEALRSAYAKDRDNISHILPRVTLPCLVFSGSEDPLCPAIERCASVLPNARFVGVPDLNHIQMGLQLGRILPHLADFLSRVANAGTQ